MTRPAPSTSSPRTRPGRAGPEEQWSDSFYFGGGDGRGLAFYSRIGRRPNEGVTEGALGIWLPGQGFLLRFARERRAASHRSAAAPRLLRVPPAARHSWELRFEGARAPVRARRAHRDRARRLPRRSHVDGSAALHRLGRPAVVPVRPRRRRSPAPTTSSPARSPGTIEVDGSAGIRSPAAGMRDHSWGVRDWQRVPYWRWFGMVADPDNFLVLNNVGLARRRRDGGRLPDARRRDRADRLVRDRVRARPRARVPALASSRARATRRAARRRSRAARSRWRRCASAATAG